MAFHTYIQNTDSKSGEHDDDIYRKDFNKKYITFITKPVIRPTQL